MSMLLKTYHQLKENVTLFRLDNLQCTPSLYVVTAIVLPLTNDYNSHEISYI